MTSTWDWHYPAYLEISGAQGKLGEICEFLGVAMPNLCFLIFVIIALIESVAGLLGNVAILVISSASWARSKILSSYDMLMIFLSLSRICLQYWIMQDLFVGLVSPSFYYVDNLFVTYKTVFMFLNYASLWFAAWLSVFYCTKVATSTQSFFIWLKQRISKLVPWMLITSSLFSFATSLPFFWDIYRVHDNFTTSLTVTNSSERTATMKTSFFLLILLCNSGIALPLILFVVSSILLIRSLWRHMRKMQNNTTGFRDSCLEAHMRAIKSVLSFLILYVTYFIALVLILSDMFLPFSTGEALCTAVMATCPSGHTMILIWSNPKFRDLPARILHHTNCQRRPRSI